MSRRLSREIKIRDLVIGAGAPVAVQTMSNVPMTDSDAVLTQIKAMQAAGAKLVRVSVPDKTAVQTLVELRKKTDMPLCADIHFDYRLAIAAAEAGADKIRINPGNIGSEDRVRAVVEACRAHKVPIRIGVNGGSLEKEIVARYGNTAEAMAESARYHASLLEKLGFYDIVISVKSSDVRKTVEATRLIAAQCSYPLHLGVTEAGTENMGVIKSAVGIGALLCDGIGDTIRVSLTADPVKEVTAGYNILRTLGLYEGGVEIISCPTCARTRIDIISIAAELERLTANMKKNIKVAVMGCAVNGPGEARGCDIGIAGGNGEGLLFKNGEIIRKIPESEIISQLIKEIEDFNGNE